MTNSQQMTDKQAAQLFLELLTNDAPLYEVQPDPGKGATIKTGRFTESRLKGVPLPKVHARIVSTSVEPAEKTPTEAMAIPAIREAHKRVRKAVADDGDLIAVLDKLATVRAAAERQRARYVNKHVARERDHQEMRDTGLSVGQIEAVAYMGAHELLSGLVRTLALLAACDFVEAWYLETGELPSESDIAGPDPELVRKAMNEKRRAHCYAVLTACEQSRGGFGLMKELAAAASETAVKKAQKVLRIAQVSYEDGTPDAFERALRSVMDVDSQQMDGTF